MRDRPGDALDWAGALLPGLTRGRTVDVGCGEGRFLPDDGVGVDVDPGRAREARARSRRVVVASVHALPFPSGTFDTAYAHRMLNDAGRIDHALAEIARVLARGGRLVVLTRARPAQGGDRLDRWNGEERLGARFERVRVHLHPHDERAALFVADRPRAPARALGD